MFGVDALATAATSDRAETMQLQDFLALHGAIDLVIFLSKSIPSRCLEYPIVPFISETLLLTLVDGAVYACSFS